MARGGARRRIGARIARVMFAAGIGRHTLGARGKAPLAFLPVEPWPGDSSAGAQVADGHGAPTPGASGAAEYDPAPHAFEYLRDLRALGGEAARVAARRRIEDWIAHETRLRSVAWQPEVLAHRLTQWLLQAEFVSAGADDAFRAQFHEALARQANYLARVAALSPGGAKEIEVHKALIYACLALPGARRRLARWIHSLTQVVGEQVLADGGHVERNPEAQLAVLRDLVDVRANLRAAQEEVPGAIQGAIDRMAPMLRFWRHGDGRLALFNGASESRDWMIDMVLTQADARGKPLTAAPHTGFQRLSAHRTLVLADVGPPPPPGLDTDAHAAPLAFELSVGRERLVVNCGGYAGPNAAWREASRTTAAHSTLVVDDVNAVELLPGGGLGARPSRVLADRRESDGNLWVDAEHNGYARAYGLIHKRRLFLSAAGDDLRGEDTLEGPGHRKFAVRFHLHPDVKASPVQGGASVLLRTASGIGWRMRASGGVITLQESVYLGAGGEARRTDQIVISAATDGQGAQVKWAFSRVAN
jgi:uncharacterized heparinase superfamily protein